MNAPARQVQHTNPYHKDNEKEQHDLFEAAWSKKTSFGNFIGMAAHTDITFEPL